MHKKLTEFRDGHSLPVVEEFHSLQGEGFHTGKAAYFLRIGGCDLACSWCDSPHSWDPALHPLHETNEIIDRIIGSSVKSVVVTGGEPLMCNLDFLCTGLKNAGIETFLETSGSYPLSGIWDWVCLSPKIQQPPLGEIFSVADELKIIVAGQEDFDWALENEKKVSGKCHLYLQPEWSVHRQITPLIVEFIKNNPRWRISLQAHKFMRIP